MSSFSSRFSPRRSTRNWMSPILVIWCAPIMRFSSTLIELKSLRFWKVRPMPSRAIWKTGLPLIWVSP